MEQPSRFQKLVATAKRNITEISVADAKKQAEAGAAILIDVREEEDWKEGHAHGAKHFSRGVIEMEIEDAVPDPTKTNYLLLRRRKPLRARRGKSAEDGI